MALFCIILVPLVVYRITFKEATLVHPNKGLVPVEVSKYDNQEAVGEEEEQEYRFDNARSSSNYSEELIDTKSLSPTIERIFYINMAERTERRRFMEGWLNEQSLPYERVEALTANYNKCA